MLLVVDCCIRGGASATRKYYEAYLKTAAEHDASVIKLAELGIEPLNAETLRKRDELCGKREFDHEMFRMARQFRDADEILIAAPFWDLSFPSLLKVYLEQVSVCGLTFRYEDDGSCIGCCKAKRLLYFSTCGGYFGEHHLGFEYVKAFAAMLGIKECVPYIIEGLDIDPARRQDILDRAVRRLQHGC